MKDKIFFELDPSQQERFKKWKQQIKQKHGSYGQYTYKFTPTGIGCCIEIYSDLSKQTLDLSDVEKW